MENEEKARKMCVSGNDSGIICNVSVCMRGGGTAAPDKGQKTEVETEKPAKETGKKKVLTVNEAFHQEGIWFYSPDGTPGKNRKIQAIMAFDGKGNVTSYETQCGESDSFEWATTYSDLKDLSEEEILELAKELDRKVFDDLKARDLNAEAKGPQKDTLHAQIEAVEYREPQPQPFTIRVLTDQTGNNTVNEIIEYPYSTYIPGYDPFGDYTDKLGMYEKLNAKIELYPSPENSTVYDKQFNGFGKLFVQVGEGHPGFALDSPDTEGVQVD